MRITSFLDNRWHIEGLFTNGQFQNKIAKNNSYQITGFGRSQLIFRFSLAKNELRYHCSNVDRLSLASLRSTCHLIMNHAVSECHNLKHIKQLNAGNMLWPFCLYSTCHLSQNFYTGHYNLFASCSWPTSRFRPPWFCLRSRYAYTLLASNSRYANFRLIHPKFSQLRFSRRLDAMVTRRALTACQSGSLASDRWEPAFTLKQCR